jgi:hypothetical protein
LSASPPQALVTFYFHQPLAFFPVAHPALLRLSHRPFPVFQKKKNDFGRRYNAITQIAANHNSTVLPFIDPTSVLPQRSEALVRMRTMMSFLDSDEFQRFCYLKYMSLAREKIESLNITLSLRQSTICMDGSFAFAHALYDRLFNGFT